VDETPLGAGDGAVSPSAITVSAPVGAANGPLGMVARIEESPAQFPIWQGNPRFRKAVLPETFPFVVFFRELNDCIRILAVAHGARKPG